MPQKKDVGNVDSFARIRVIGIGGSGKNAVNHMVNEKLTGIEFIVANTDSQDLEHSLVSKKIYLGSKITRGLGTGMNPDLGRESAESSIDDIKDMLKGADMIFLAGGMGGGTGTGASPVIARIAKDLGILVVAIVTLPFEFEGIYRMKVAQEGVESLREHVDSIVIIPNDNLIEIADKSTTMRDAFAMSDNILLRGVQGISDLITRPGIINIDFADVHTIMKGSGVAVLGVGHGEGQTRVDTAIDEALFSPVVGLPIIGAKRVLFSVATKTKSDVGILEIQEIAKRVTDLINPDGQIIFGTVEDDKLKQGQIRITVIATDIEESNREKGNHYMKKGISAAAMQKEKRETEGEENGGTKKNGLPRASGLPQRDDL